MQYYLYFKNAVIGPMTLEQVAAYNCSSETQVSTDGKTWAPLYTYPELMQLYAAKRPLMDITVNNKLLCGLLAIILGGLGIHYFILGKVPAGIITIVLAIVTCGLWSIVMLIQGIMMLCMSDEVFESKYVHSTSTYPLF